MEKSIYEWGNLHDLYSKKISLLEKETPAAKLEFKNNYFQFCRTLDEENVFKKSNLISDQAGILLHVNQHITFGLVQHPYNPEQFIVALIHHYLQAQTIYYANSLRNSFSTLIFPLFDQRAGSKATISEFVALTNTFVAKSYLSLV